MKFEPTPRRIHIQDILSRLNKLQKTPNGWQACCPAHDDENPSLSIKEGDEGLVLLYCFAGCSYESIVAALGLSNAKRRVAATYDYVDENGKRLYQVVRYEPKDFRQRCPDGKDGWTWKLQGVKRVLYKLPQLIAVEPQETIYVCEGEKDADKLASLGLIATTNVGGAEKWRAEYNEYLRGRNVVVLPDNDKAGRAHAELVAKSLHGLATSVRIVELPNLSEKGDVSDFLTNGGTIEQLLEIVSTTEPYSPNSFVSSNSLIRTRTDLRKVFPKINNKALYGLAGEFVETIYPHTESDKAALLIQMLVGFGNIIGRKSYYVAESTRHYLNLYALIVGSTSAAKGSSLNQVRNILNLVDEGWAENSNKGGLSSGEGLVEAVNDEDRRLFVRESEFAAVLARQGRDTNTLSTVLRELWDDGCSHVMNRKQNAVSTADAHVSLVGHITPDELGRRLNSNDLVNGYANRFLFACVRRSKDLPDGGNLSQGDINRLVTRFQQAKQFAQSVSEMKRDDEANKLWRSIYPQLVEDKEGAFGKVVARARAQILRLSCIYALLDCSGVVKRVHLESAVTAWQYCEDSARYIFGQGNTLSDNAQKLLDALYANVKAGKDVLTRTEQSEVFGRNKPVSLIDAARDELVTAGIAELVEPKDGSRKPMLKLVTKYELDELDESDGIEQSKTSAGSYFVDEGNASYPTIQQPINYELEERKAIIEFEGGMTKAGADYLSQFKVAGELKPMELFRGRLKPKPQPLSERAVPTLKPVIAPQLYCDGWRLGSDGILRNYKGEIVF